MCKQTIGKIPFSKYSAHTYTRKINIHILEISKKIDSSFNVFFLLLPFQINFSITFLL